MPNKKKLEEPKTPRSVSMGPRMQRALLRFCEERELAISAAVGEFVRQGLEQKGYWGNENRCFECASDKLTRHDWLITCRECGHVHPAYSFSGEEDK